MPQLPSRPSSSLHWARLFATTACALSSLMLTACVTPPRAEPPIIVRCPRPAPLSESVSRINAQPSTESLQKAEAWLRSSAATLLDETLK